MKQFLVVFFFFQAITLIGQTSKIKIITLSPHMSFQNYEHYKRLTLNSPDSELEYLNGFDFEWGYDYKIQLKEIKLKNTLSDGSRFDYEIVKIVSKTKVADSIQFKLFIDPKRYYYDLPEEEADKNNTMKALSDSVYQYMDKVEIEVPSNLREEFVKLSQSKSGRRGVFGYVDKNRIRLINFN